MIPAPLHILPHAIGLERPERATPHAAGMDLRAALPEDDVRILPPGGRVLVPTELGQISVIETYDYYDIPRLFLAVNQIGQLFLAYNLDHDKGDTEWYYVPISAERLSLMKASKVDLFSGISEPELGFVYHIHIKPADDFTSIEKCAAENIIYDWIADPGEFLLNETGFSNQISLDLVSKSVRLFRECPASAQGGHREAIFQF